MKTKEEKEAGKAYDLMAEDYHFDRTKRYPQGWFYNELLEMPATLELLGNVRGKKILDFGCGSGIYAKLLTKKGAKIKGFDNSQAMLNIARRNNPTLDLRKGSGYKIPFKEKFDIVYAALVIDYFDDWDKVFKQVYRVLNKGGVFIFSAGNPVSECLKTMYFGRKKYKVMGMRDYFDEKVHHANWTLAEKVVAVPSYHKTYETIIKTILRNGFEIVDYKDTFPLKKAKKLFPKDYALYSKIPYFCVFKIKKK